MNIENRVSRWSVMLGIVIVLNLFFNYALSLVYKSPQYNDFCSPQPYIAQPIDQKTADIENQKYVTCQKNWDEVRNIYNRNVFVVLVVLGALSVAAGNFFVGNIVITNGLALGGVFSFIIASIRYWSAANDLIRVIILAIALGILFWVAMKKFNDRIRSERN